MFTHLQVKEAFFPLGISGTKVTSGAGPGSRSGEGLGESPLLQGGWGAGPTPGAHLDGILPRVVLGQQLVPISVQLVDGLLLLLQLPMDEVLDGER